MAPSPPGRSGTVAIQKVSAVRTPPASGLAIANDALCLRHLRGSTSEPEPSTSSAQTFRPRQLRTRDLYWIVSLPAGFAPFNVREPGRQSIYVTSQLWQGPGHDIPGPGNGFVNVFDNDRSHLLQRLVSTESSTRLGEWLSLPPASALLQTLCSIGNFLQMAESDAFDRTTGALLGKPKRSGR